MNRIKALYHSLKTIYKMNRYKQFNMITIDTVKDCKFFYCGMELSLDHFKCKMETQDGYFHATIKFLRKYIYTGKEADP